MLNRPRHCQQGRGSKRAERSGRGLLASHTLPLPPNVIRRRRTPFGAPPSVLGQPWESNRLRHDCRDAPGRAARLRTRAIAVDNGASADDGKSGLGEVLLLGALFASWYMANIVFNIYNKEVLKVFPLPLTCTTAQFLIGSALALSAWVTGAVRKPEVTPSLLLRLVPLALVHTLGNLLTNVSLGAVAVSFTHTIKALEPIFSVALCSVFLGDRPHPLVLLTLLPIMGGVALASVAEATFNWPGFLAAMGSNLTFQSRNVLSKKLMIKKKKAPVVGPNGVPAAGGSGGSAGLDNINLFSIITCMSALLLLPVCLAREGWALAPGALAAAGVADPNRLWSKLAMAGLCFHAYQQVSYMILSRVSPVTHSVGNCVKRVIVIVASVIVFQNPVSTQSLIGTSVALAGVFAYSQAKRATNPACEVVPPKAA